MQIKTYRADSMQEAIALVRRELGPDASILHTRQTSAGVLGWLGGRQIEVTATNDLPVPSRIERSPTAVPKRKPPSAKRPAWAGSGEEKIETTNVSAADAADYRQAYREALKQREDDAPSVVEQLSGKRHQAGMLTSGVRQQALGRLVEAGFSHTSAEALLAAAVGTINESASDDFRTIAASIQFQLAQRIRTAGPIQPGGSGPHVVAVVGPTGVGKTTTVAKLAAQFRLRDKLRVGLVTDDIHRVAALERLQGYAQTLDLPVETATTPLAVKSALAKLSSMELILIDTAGHSPRDADQLKLLNGLLRAANPREVHLAVSAATGEASLRMTAQRFAAVGIDRLLLTKLDETTALGGIYPLLTETNWPVGYVTNGQNVPHDIRAVTSAMLAEWMIT